MWQQYERLKDRGSLDHSHPAFLHDDRGGSRKDHSEYHDKHRLRTDNRRHRLAHMDEVVGNGENYASGSISTYWMRQLEKAKAADPNRCIYFLSCSWLANFCIKMPTRIISIFLF